MFKRGSVSDWSITVSVGLYPTVYGVTHGRPVRDVIDSSGRTAVMVHTTSVNNVRIDVLFVGVRQRSARLGLILLVFHVGVPRRSAVWQHRGGAEVQAAAGTCSDVQG